MSTTTTSRTDRQIRISGEAHSRLVKVQHNVKAKSADVCVLALLSCWDRASKEERRAALVAAVTPKDMQ